MKSTNWKDNAELIGIAAIVASLIFVGLQMKQSQDIAIATQYHERAVLAVEWLHTQHETGDFPKWANRCFPGNSTEMPPDQIEQAAHTCINLASLMTINDNHLFQYEAGYLDEQAWQARREAMKGGIRNPGVRALVIDQRLDYRQSFVSLAKKLLEETESESSK